MNRPDDLRLLGVDYGRRRTGLALSDPEGRLAFPLETLTCRGLDDLAARISERARTHEVSRIVLGLPLHLDRRPGELVAEVEGLAERLRSRGWTVVLWEEQLTSWEAARRLGEVPGAGRRSKESIDAAAAAVLLQSYLENRKGG